MPELPDVEVFRRRLAAGALHRPVADLSVHDSRMLAGVSSAKLRRVLRDHTLEDTHRHGKHLFAAVSTGSWLVLHFGMTGFLEYRQRTEPARQHARLSLTFTDGTILDLVDQRRLGFVSVCSNVERYVRENDLGPDALTLGPGAVQDALAARRRTLKSGLMEQSLTSGIGNIYADEILFQSRLHPQLPTTETDTAAWRRLHRHIRRMLTMAADRGADPERLPRTWLLPHRSDGARCPRCRGRVRKTRLSGRATFHCPSCQDPPRAA